MGADTTPQVYVDGSRLSTIASGWGDLKITDRWPHGNWEMSWTVPASRVNRVRELQADREVRCYVGGGRRFTGFMSEPNWDTGEMVALGSVRAGETALALDGPGAITTIPNLAIDQAYIRGAVPWVRTTDFSSLAFTDPAQSSAPVYLNAMLDAWATFNGVGWGVNGRNHAFVAADPTVPSFIVAPDSGALGVADGVLARSVVGRYLADATTYANVRVGTTSPEVGVDLTKFGVMNPTTATAKAQQVLDMAGEIRGWTNGLTLAASQIFNRGGVPVNLATVIAGKMMRLQGLRDERGRSAVTDIVLGETVWDVSDATVLCNPVGLVARDLGSIVEDVGGSLLTGI